MTARLIDCSSHGCPSTLLRHIVSACNFAQLLLSRQRTPTNARACGVFRVHVFVYSAGGRYWIHDCLCGSVRGVFGLMENLECCLYAIGWEQSSNQPNKSTERMTSCMALLQHTMAMPNYLNLAGKVLQRKRRSPPAWGVNRSIPFPYAFASRPLGSMLRTIPCLWNDCSEIHARCAVQYKTSIRAFVDGLWAGIFRRAIVVQPRPRHIS
jgi:hypothetical protein